MRFLSVLWQYLRQIPFHALFHAVRASFYILAVQTARHIKNKRRRFKRKFPLFWKRLYTVFVKPIFMLFCFALAPRGRRLRCFTGGILRLVLLTCCILFSFGTIQGYRQLRFAYEVRYCNAPIGYVSSSDTLNEGMKQASQIMQFLDIEELPTLSYSLAQPREFLDAKAVGDAIVNCHSDELSAASGLFINGEYLGAVPSRSELDTLLETLRTAQDTGKESRPSTFAQKVEVVDGAYPKGTITSVKSLQKTLLKQKKKAVKYTVKSGDTLIGIARASGLTLGELRERNPAYKDTDMLQIGDVLVIEKASSLLQICRYVKATYKEAIPYETKVYFNDNFFVNEERVYVEGQNGVQRVTAEIEYTDGVETDREVLKSTVLKKPVTKKMRIGTQKGNRPQGSGIASGKFRWPLPHFTTITSYFGPRWGTVHQGLDISGYNVYGASIVAADGGTVYAVNRTNSWGTGMFAGYGYAVIIDHGNGLRTLYAHCSRIAVTPGQRVTKGQVIAYVGNTGRSTGAHLHFEVRVNNVRVNPLNYLR